MAKAIEDFGGVIVGHVTLMLWGQGSATPGQAVHDGDTIGSDPKGNLSVRFLGVDAPEISFTLPGGGPEEFVHPGDQGGKPSLQMPSRRVCRHSTRPSRMGLRPSC